MNPTHIEFDIPIYDQKFIVSFQSLQETNVWIKKQFNTEIEGIRYPIKGLCGMSEKLANEPVYVVILEDYWLYDKTDRLSALSAYLSDATLKMFFNLRIDANPFEHNTFIHTFRFILKSVLDLIDKERDL